MKNNLLIALISCSSLLSCGTLSITQDTGQQPDANDIVASILTELKKSDKVYFVTVSPSSEISDATICGYPIAQEFKITEDYYQNVLDFILSDTTLLTADSTVIKQPFYPTFGFKPSKKSRISCLVSFGTEEIAFSRNDSTYVKFHLNTVTNLQHLYELIKTTNISDKQ